MMTNTILIGDSRKLIKQLPDKSLDCVVTSPPYWGLRDYGHPDQIGLEKTPEEYLNKLVTFFDDVSCKLKDTGTCFVNLGDTYSGSGCETNDYRTEKSKSINGIGKTAQLYKTGGVARGAGIPAKSLCMIPQRFAWMMIEHGWILRNEIIWAKTNYMPESSKDRFTKSHEVVWFFTKQGKYHFDMDAVLEPYTKPLNRWGGNGYKRETLKKEEMRAFMKFGSTSNLVKGNMRPNPKGRHPNDVFRLPVGRYKGAHFATFPEHLIKPLILAGCPESGTVLDPFAGSGTVGRFCAKNNRHAILFDCNESYKSMMEEL